jgi:hypothetical protein
MALTKITKSGITNDAIDATKLGDDVISDEHLDITTITDQPDLGEAAASGDYVLIYDTSAGTLKKVSAGNVGTQSVTLTSITPTSVLSGDGTGNYTFTLTGSNFTGATAVLVTDGGSEVDFDTVTIDSVTQITAVISKSSLSNANEPYDVKVYGSNGTQALLRNQINIDASPAFVTAAGSLGSSRFSMSGISVNATDPDSAGNVTFELQSGSLPPGISITNTAAEGGTATFTGTFSSLETSDTIYNFTLRAVDAASNTSSRAFSFTALGPQVSSFTSSGTFTAPTGLTSVDVLVVAGGGGGGAGHPSYNAGAGGGAGGLIFFPGYPVTTGTITVTVGCGGPGGPGPTNVGQSGQDSVFGSPGDPGLGQGGVLTAKGGGGGAGGYSCTLPGGSGGGSGNAGTGGSATQPTQPGNSGAYGFGNAGANGAPNAATGGAGGGGAGGAGIVYAATSPNSGGHGGLGKSYTIADGTTPVYYSGGGGGGGGYNNTVGWVSNGVGGGSPGPQGGGGPGGGGRQPGDPAAVGTGVTGTANRGGGGGGGQLAESGTPVGGPSGFSDPGGAGGKGIVIVRY